MYKVLWEKREREFIFVWERIWENFLNDIWGKRKEKKCYGVKYYMNGGRGIELDELWEKL